MKRIISIIFLIFISKNILNSDRIILQIGAFKNNTNIKILKNKFKQYKTKSVQNEENNITKFFVICQSYKCYEEVIQLIPNAYIVQILKDKKKDNTKNKTTLSKSNNTNNTTHKKITNTIKPTSSFDNYLQNNGLNSKTIIKTRNIYFK